MRDRFFTSRTTAADTTATDTTATGTTASAVLLVLGTAVFVFVGTAPLPLVTPFTIEDALFESLTAVFFLIAGLLWALHARNTADRVRLVAVLGALFCLFCFGEEISWFQRVFDYATPAAWRTLNVQEEANLHNLTLWNGGPWRDAVASRRIDVSLLLSASNIFRMGFVLFFLVCPAIVWRGHERLVRWMAYRAPSRAFVAATWVALGVSIVVAFSTHAPDRLKALSETREMVYAAVILLYTWLFVFRARRTPELVPA